MKNFQSLVKKIVISVVVVLASLLLINITMISIDKSEVSSCMKLKQQAKDYTGFFLLQWQDEMCQAHDINIDAPIR